MRSSKRKKRRTELFEDKRALGKILIEQCWVGRTEMLVVEEVKEEEEMKEEANKRISASTFQFLVQYVPVCDNSSYCFIVIQLLFTLLLHSNLLIFLFRS